MGREGYGEGRLLELETVLVRLRGGGVVRSERQRDEEREAERVKDSEGRRPSKRTWLGK
jgi:hypothetical protein